MRTLNREEWTALCNELQGAEGEFRGSACISGDHGSLDFNDDSAMLNSETSVWVRLGATDIRIGQVQLLVSKTHATLILSHPPYPIGEWTVLWDGELPFKREVSAA